NGFVPTWRPIREGSSLLSRGRGRHGRGQLKVVAIHKREIAPMKYTITLALFLFLSLTIILTAPVKAREGQSPEPYNYTSFHGEHLTLYPYPGQKVALLVPSPDLDEATLYRIVGTFDAAYDYYHSATGREP